MLLDLGRPHVVISRQGLRLTSRDRQILTLARRRLLGAADCRFEEAARALREATEEVIPAGRVFFLGGGDRGPILGSLITGVGITESDEAVRVVRVRGGAVVVLGGFL